MANPEHERILAKGVSFWNHWRNENPNIRPDLTGVDISQRFLGGINFHSVNLEGANLESSDFLPQLRQSVPITRSKATGEKIVVGNNARIPSRATDMQGANLNSANLKLARLGPTMLCWSHLVKADLSGAMLGTTDFRWANLHKANFSGAYLNQAKLDGANIVEADFSGADLVGCNVYGVNAWKLKLEGTTQRNLIITPLGETPIISVDNIEVAQFIYLILSNEKLRDVINEITSKAVLILGRFSDPERKDILDSLRNQLNKLGFLPIVFDFERPTDRDFTETIMTLAGMSLFVIADITAPKSSPLELQATVPDYQIPFVPIIQRGERPFSMLENLQSKYDWVLETLEYKDENELNKLLEVAIIKRAFQKLEEIQEKKDKARKILTAKDFSLENS